MKPCLSVVIPFFNVEEYLSACLDSLMKTEGISDTEILLVDDGSTDGSVQIADKYSAEYDIIRVMHKENKGPSAARNLGLMESSGEYVFFCDSDDEVVPELFAGITQLTKTSTDDIILWDSELRYETRNLLVPKNRDFFAHGGLEKTERTYTGKEILETMLRESGNFVATIWLGAYRRDFLIDNDLFFEEGLIHEDELLLPKIFINAESVHYIPEKIYSYRIRSGSIMIPVSGDRKESAKALMYIYPALYTYYDEALEEGVFKKLIEGNLTKRYLYMIYKYRICRYGYGKQIDKKLLWRKALRVRDKVLVLFLYLYAH